MIVVEQKYRIEVDANGAGGYWKWDNTAPGVGWHYTKEGHADMGCCCPYIPQIMKDKELRATDKIHKRIKDAGASYGASDNISKFINFDEMKEVEEELTQRFKGVLDSLIIDLEDANSKDTPNRLAKMYLYEIMGGRYEDQPKTTSFPNEGNKQYNGMIVIRAEIKSVCAHHWQPISGTAYIGIIPNGKVMGLSKYIRLAQWCSRRGTLQEELCNDIADAISNTTDSANVGVYIAAEHGCCTNRGVNAHSALTQTTVLRGFFDSDVSTKKEFFDNIQLQELHSKTR